MMQRAVLRTSRAGGSLRSSRRAALSTTPCYHQSLSYPAVSKEDFGKFKEYSVIHTDRSLNLMSDPFQRVMRDLNSLLKVTYNADKVVIIPGYVNFLVFLSHDLPVSVLSRSGTFGMEAVARQFATDEHVMVIRNGWFSYRWTEIFDMNPNHPMPKSHTVLKAQPVEGDGTLQFMPHPVKGVVDRIHTERPAVVFAPHVETSTGMILPDDYIASVAQATHEVGGIFVLDCIASGTVWVDMKALGVDVLISAPQKGWTGPPCAALVQMSNRAVELMKTKQETSFSMSLKRWAAIMDTYENGGFGYHTTMPTDALRDFHDISVETLKFGLPELKHAQLEMGKQVREVLDSKGLVSVAAPGFQAPGVLVYFSPAGTENPVMMNRFKEQGLQIAMGVPWKIDEPEGLKTFRIGLFGLDKLGNIPATVETMETALNSVLGSTEGNEPKAA